MINFARRHWADVIVGLCLQCCLAVGTYHSFVHVTRTSSSCAHAKMTKTTATVALAPRLMLRLSLDPNMIAPVNPSIIEPSV